ncbi:TetR family transcriptional regulator [Stackebrandtia soli]|uniref:TetR family transcriptional regulator n=1 Tax=Stackebrandtia soli TaxID=1892856 RepID=UPI0039ED35C7
MTEHMGLRERRRRRTRAAIVAAATRLFSERGVADTTIADIAAAAEIAPRTFFLHFPSKEDVLFHHVEEYVDLAIDAVARTPLEDGPRRAVRSAVRSLVDAFDATSSVSALADQRAALVARSGPGLPATLAARLVDAQRRVLSAVAERFPGRSDSMVAAQLGACLWAAASAAVVTTGAARSSAMREAVERAAAGFDEPI